MNSDILTSDALPKCRYCGHPMYDCVNMARAYFKCGKCGAQTPMVYRSTNMDMSNPEASYFETEQAMMLRALDVAKQQESVFAWCDFNSYSELPEGEDILIAGQDSMENAVYIVAFRTMEGELIIPGTSFTLREGLFSKMKYTLLYDPFQKVDAL